MKDLVTTYGYYYVFDDDNYIYILVPGYDDYGDHDMWIYTGMSYL